MVRLQSVTLHLFLVPGPSEPATFVQRLPNVYQTLWTFIDLEKKYYLDIKTLVQVTNEISRNASCKVDSLFLSLEMQVAK